MKHENGIWLYRGKIYDTLHDALQVAWDKKLEVHHDNRLAVYRPCSGFCYNSMDMPGGGSDVKEMEEPMRLIDAHKLSVDMEEKVFCSNGGTQFIFGYSYAQVHSLPTIDPPAIALPPNDPLTLDELREMDGEPVWIAKMDGSGGVWMLVDAEYELCREAHGEMAVFENCGKTWLAYRCRPGDGAI